MRQNQNLIKQPFCKCLVALLLSFFYLVAELSFFPYPAFAQNQIPLNVREGSLIGNSLTSSQMTEIALSPELGTIDEFHQGTNGKTIIYIQDAHDSLEAQEHIAKMITYLVEKNEVKTVFEEGYEGLVPTDELFSAFETPQAKEKVSYFLMDKLRLGGAEYAHINRNKDFELVGIDSIKLQKENIEWYKKSADQRESVEKDLTVIRKKIDVLVNRSFPKEIKEWMNLKIRLDNHQIDFLDYLKRITKDSNLDGYPNIALLIKAQLRNDQQSTVDAKNIDTKALFQEVDQFENDYARLHLSEPKDIQTYQIYKSLKLLERLNRVEISSEEFDLAQKALSETSTEKIAEFLFEVTNVPVILSNQWEENIKNAIQFYKTAEARDGVLEKALKEYKELPDREQAILIFGGFHKNRIKSILSEQNYSYFIVTPKITELSEKHQIFYKTLMGIGYHPFEVPSSLRTAARTLSSIVEPQLLNRIHLAVRDFSPDWETWTRETFDLNMTGALMLERSELRANDANEEIWSRFYATGGGNSASMEDLKKIRPFWQRLFHAFEKPVKALDYGTGKFVIAQEMLQHLPEGSEVHAVDLADPRHLVAPQGIQYHQIPGENLSKKFAPQTFDLITGLHALEYGDIDRIIDEIKIIAKPGAKLAFVMHHHESVYVKGSQMMIEESEIVQAANVFNLLKKYLKNPKPENLNRLQAAGQILFEQNELRRSQRRKTDDLEKIMKLIQLANHMMKHKGKENALQYVERHMEQYHAHIQIARMMVEKAGIYGEHNGTELRLLLEAKGFHVEVLKPFVRERKLLGWQVEMRMPGGSPPLAGVMPWDQDQVYKHNRADLTVQIVKADALDQFTIQTYKDGKVSGEKQVIFKKDFDAFFTEFKKISEMGIRSELRYQPISVQVADDLDDMSIAGAGARVFIQTLIKLSNKYPEAEKDFEIIAAALSGVDGEIRQPFAMVDWIYGEPWQRLNRLYAKKVKPNDPSPDRWTKIVDLSHEIEMAIRQLKQGLHNSKENSQTHIDILSKKMAEQPAFGLFTILAVASEKLVKENRTLNYEAILKAIQMRSPSEDWLSENFIPLLNTIKAISQFSDVNRIELIDFMYELLKASSHRSLDSFFQGSLFLTDLMEMEASVEPFERHYEFLIQKIVGKLGEVPKTVTSNVLANTLREMKSKLGKAEVFDQAFYEFVMNGEKSETQKTQKIPTLFYRDAENLLAKRMPTLALILKDKNKMSRLVTALTFLRRMHEKLDPPQDSSLTNLEYADQTRSYVQFGEMRLTFLGGSFRRHVLYVGEGEERFALDLKIPGDQYMGGMERRFVWEENFKVGRDLWQKHGKRSGVAKPLFLYRLIGGPFNLYGVEQSFEAGYNKTFGVVGTLYNDGRRFNTLNFKNPQQSPYLKRVATENQMTMEKLVENAVRATALFTKRVHDAGYRDWDEDSWSDLHDGNMRLQLNGRSEQVADLESMRKEGMEAADRVEQMQFSVGFAPLEIAQSVLPGIVKRAGLDPSDLHWEAMPEATGESLADPQQRHLRSHSQNGHSLVQQNWLQQRSGGLDRSELRSLKELFVSEEVEKIKQRGVWLQMLYPKLNEEAQRVLLHPTFLPVFMGMKPAYFRIEDELRQEPDPVVLYDELNRLAEENDEILKYDNN
jgi:hypothetical protein